MCTHSRQFYCSNRVLKQFSYIFFSFTSNCNTEPTDTVSKQTAGLTNPFFYIEPTTEGLDTWFGVAPSVSVLPEAPDFLRIRIKPIECFAGTSACRSTSLHEHVCATYYDLRILNDHFQMKNYDFILFKHKSWVLAYTSSNTHKLCFERKVKKHNVLFENCHLTAASSRPDVM